MYLGNITIYSDRSFILRRKITIADRCRKAKLKIVSFFLLLLLSPIGEKNKKEKKKRGEKHQKKETEKNSRKTINEWLLTKTKNRLMPNHFHTIYPNLLRTRIRFFSLSRMCADFFEDVTFFPTLSIPIIILSFPLKID